MVRKSTPAITSLLAKVLRLQCHEYRSILASASAVGKPATRSLKRIVAVQGREDRIGSLRLAGALLLFAFQIILVFQSVESAHSYDVQRNGPRIAVLGFGKMNLSPLEIDLVPAQTVLLAHAHPGVKGKQQVRQKLEKSMLDGLAQPRLFMIREKPHPSVALRRRNKKS